MIDFWKEYYMDILSARIPFACYLDSYFFKYNV